MMLLPFLMMVMRAPVAAPPDACVVVEQDRIRARDLAATVPEFASIDGEQFLAYSPAYGIVRTITARELSRMAARHGVRLLNVRDICVERPMRDLDAGLLMEAMRKELPQATIEVLGFSRRRVPAGELVFSAKGLAASGSRAGDVALWRGHVAYAGNRKFPVWAKVRIAMQFTRVVAVEAISPGRPVGDGQVRLESYSGLPPGRDTALSVESVRGRVLKRSVAAGAVIKESDLEEAWDINRGDIVTVVARDGAAQVSTTARALAAARKGDRITVRNLQSGKVIAARADGAGRVSVGRSPEIQPVWATDGHR